MRARQLATLASGRSGHHPRWRMAGTRLGARDPLRRGQAGRAAARARNPNAARRDRNAGQQREGETRPSRSPACATACSRPNSSAKTRSVRCIWRIATCPNSPGSCKASMAGWSRRAAGSRIDAELAQLIQPSTPARSSAPRSACAAGARGRAHGRSRNRTRQGLEAERRALSRSARCRPSTPRANPATPRTRLALNLESQRAQVVACRQALDRAWAANAASSMQPPRRTGRRSCPTATRRWSRWSKSARPLEQRVLSEKDQRRARRLEGVDAELRASNSNPPEAPTSRRWHAARGDLAAPLCRNRPWRSRRSRWAKLSSSGGWSLDEVIAARCRPHAEAVRLGKKSWPTSTHKMRRLEPVNLAAIQEHGEAVAAQGIPRRADADW
jgi:chromosome segregation protein